MPATSAIASLPAQSVRHAALTGCRYGKRYRRCSAERESGIQQNVSRAVVSTEIVDIIRAAGIQSPDISILSDDFLAEVRQMERKNLALEALEKLINGEVRSQGKRNVVQSKAFSDRLQEAIARYHSNAITTVQLMEELIKLG